MAAITWSETTVTVNVGSTATVNFTFGKELEMMHTVTTADAGVATISTSGDPSGFNGVATITGVSAGTTVTVPGGSDVQNTALTITVVAADDEEYLNKRGLTHFWSNIDSIKQDKLTAGTGISITGNTISATGGGVADSVAWGHITGTMADQTDLTNALSAKANSASLATVATSGSYNDLSNKPTIPSIKRRTGGSTTSDVSLLYVAGDGTTTTPMALKTHGDSHTGSFSYVNINEPTNNITEAYVGGYVWDEYEDWWSKKNEVRLALYSDIPAVPTKTSDLTNDSGFLTSVAWGDVTGKPTFATVATSGSYNDLSNKPTIPAAQVNSDWNASSGVAQILNKPSLATVATTGAYSDLTGTPSLATVATSGSYSDLSNKPSIPAAQVNSDWDAVSGVAQILNKPSLATVATSGSYNDLTNKPTIPAAQVQSDWTQATTTAVDYIKNKPNLATVATSGSYNDLSNKPTIPAAQVNSDWSASSGVAQILNKPSLATVATSGSYNDLSNKPTIPTVNNATLTIQKNSTNVATFTANASSNVTANISVPTKTSDLTNDSGFITSETKEVFYIEITSIDDVDGTFTADKTFEEILAAINAGQLPVVYNITTDTDLEQVDYAPLSYYYIDDDAAEDSITFAQTSVNGTGGYGVVAGLSGKWSYFDFQRDRSGGTPVYNNYYTSDGSLISSVSSVSSSSTNTQVPGAKLFYDTISDFITADDITSTSALTPPVQTNMIANNAVTTAKIDFSDYTMGSPTKASANIDNPNAYNYYIKFGRLVIAHINIHATATINSGTDILTGFPVPIGRVCFALAGAGTRGIRGRILEGTGAFQCDDAMTENYYNGSCTYWSAA